MSLRTRNALIESIVFCILFIVFAGLFFEGNGPADWGTNKTLRVLSAGLFAMGYVVHFFMLVQNRKEVLDERARLIQLRSTSATLIIVLLYVFVFGILLYLNYESQSYIPVSWIWFLSYSTVFFTFCINSFLYFLFDKKDIGYEVK